MSELEFICPLCKSPLQGRETLYCLQGHTYAKRGGIWEMLPSDRLHYYSRFLDDYEAIRQKEGRGSTDPEFYRNLPFRDCTALFSDEWRMRTCSFRALLDAVFKEKEESSQNLLVADVGAGNGWLSYQLSRRGHLLAAVDISVSEVDGLGAHRHYPCKIESVQAEFESLPFEAEQFDLVVYNASFHYSTDYAKTLGEGLRVLKSRAQIVIMDSPIYQDVSSGEQMLEEHRKCFLENFGRVADALPSRGYLTWEQLDQLATWKWIEPDYGLRWKLRRWGAALLGRREPARFGILITEPLRHKGT